MAKNVLILMGSPRKKGNTSILCDEFKRGAEDAGHSVDKVDVAALNIHGCLGCNGCQRNGGACVQKDDMQEIYPKILAADVVVLASPIYYYTWTAQLKAVIDRTYALLSTMHNKTFYLISTCMSPDETWCKLMLDSFRTYLDCYDETVNEGGYVFGFGTGAPGDVKGTDAMQKAYEMGKGILRRIITMGKAENNKWGLVYDGAITENIEGAVNIHPLTYLVNGVKVAANVYTPAGYDEKEDKKYPAVTVAHPNGGVKEQVSGLFAQKLAENGYIAIACDAAYQGASEGEPRNTDIPFNRVEDIHAMVDYLITFPGVDAERIGLFGICGGGGYTLKAAQTEKRAKAVATLSAFNTGIVRLYGLGNSQVDTIQARLQEAADARTEEARTGKVVYPAPRGQITQEYIDSLPDGLYKDGMYYYGRDYAHPNSGGQAPVKNLLDLVDFDARQNMELISVPLLMMAGSEADTLYMTKDCFELATGTENKELFIVEGARHIPTYFVPEFVEQESAKLMEFFGKYL